MAKSIIEKASKYFKANKAQQPLFNEFEREEWTDSNMIQFAADFHEAQTKWIRVETEPPNIEHLPFLTRNEHGYQLWDDMDWFHELDWIDIVNAGDWMPLPEPPK